MNTALELLDADSLEIWTTIDGLENHICDLKDDHLRNIIFYLNKRFGSLRYMETDFLTGTPADVWPIYDVLRREAQRRGLAWI